MSTVVRGDHRDGDTLIVSQTKAGTVQIQGTANLSKGKVRDLIDALVKEAGFTAEATGNGMGIIIQFPESSAVQERREELAWKFFDTCHERLENGQEHAIEFIIDGEKERGELR